MSQYDVSSMSSIVILVNKRFLISYDYELSDDEAEEYSDILTGKAKHQQCGQQQVFKHLLEW